MHHELKIWPQYYARVAEGSKTFEVRNNDRGYQMGDTVTLKEFDPNETRKPFQYTGKELTFRIGYVLPIDGDRVVFGLLSLCQVEFPGADLSYRAFAEICSMPMSAEDGWNQCYAWMQQHLGVYSKAPFSLKPLEDVEDDIPY